MLTRLFAALLPALFFSSALFAQPGALDPTFGYNSRTIQNLLPSEDQGFAIQVRPNGRILVAGRALIGSANQFAVLQYLPDGHLDESFNRDGRITQNFLSQPEAIAYTAALYPDGRAIVAGFAGPEGEEDFGLLRIAANGSPDSSFGGAGLTFLDFDLGQDFSYAVLRQPDDKLVLAGYTSPDGFESDFALARLLPDGQPDLNFGDNGKVVQSFSAVSDLILDAELQADGFIVVAGQIYDEDFSSDYIVGRYRPDGQLDSTFGTDGIVRINLGNDDLARAVALQPDGKIVVAGITSSDFQPKIGVVRLQTNGALDNTFGNNGLLYLEAGPLGTFCTDVLIQPNGGILLAGMVEVGDFRDFFLLRRLPDGAPDLNFGIGGLTVTSVSPTNDNAYRLAQQSDGKILLVGVSEAGFQSDFTLLRYLASGKLDPDFGKNGVALTDVGASPDHLTDIAIQSDDKILAGGYSQPGILTSLGLVRYSKNGAVDSTFNNDGVWVSTPGKDRLFDLLVQPDGKILAAGNRDDQACVFRLHPDGSPDSTFGANGVGLSNFIMSSTYRCLAMRPDGSILAAGESPTAHDILVQYTPEGIYDLSFGNNGQLPFLSGFVVWNRLNLLPDGKFIGLGRRLVNGVFHNYLVKFQSSGAVDLDFADNGLLIDAGFPQLIINTKDFVVLPSGKILVAAGDLDFSVLRLNADGSLDTSFGDAGITTFDYGQVNNVPYRMIVQDNGRILVAGRSYDPMGSGVTDGFTVFQLESEGARDTTYGVGGVVHLPGILASSVGLQSNGDVIVGGEFHNGHEEDFLLYRLLHLPLVSSIDRPESGMDMINLYPNPVVSSLQVEYELAENQQLSIRLFDEAGRQVAVFLTEEMRSAGSHQETLRLPAGLPAGYYNLQFTTGNGSSKVLKIIVR